MQENENCWEKVFNNDILFKESKELKKKIKLQEFINFFSKSQTKDGYFSNESPLFYTTYACLGIIYNCRLKPNKKSIDFIKKLQVGSLGFSEMPGEMPWTTWTRYILEMMQWFGIEPEQKEKLIDFHHSLQNDDGGFKSIGIEESNLEDISNVIKILQILGSKPWKKDDCINWIITKSNIKNFNDAYNFLLSLEILEYNLKEREKKYFKKILENLDNNMKNKSYEELFYLLACEKIIGNKINNLEKYTEEIRNLNFSKIRIREIFFISKILILFNKIDEFASKFLKEVKKYEVDSGGYFTDEEIYVYKMNAAFHNIFLIGGNKKIDTKAFLKWLNKIAYIEGWGPTPYTSTERDLYTTSSLTSFRLADMNKLNHSLRKRVERKIQNKLNSIESCNYSYQSYPFCRMSRELLESLMLLSMPLDKNKIFSFIKLKIIVSIIMRFYNNDGGFGGKNLSFMYTTWLAVRALFLAEKYSECNFSENLGWLNRIKHETPEWIEKCQNEDGGFGPMPNQPSNIQATFCALYTIWMLEGRIKKGKKLSLWIRDLQHKDGGFGAYQKGKSDLLLSFYAIGSLILMSDIKGVLCT